jgi:selenocysteine-specific elongation factor
LRDLPAPFSVSDARQALGVSRRVTVPLLEHLDAGRRTRRLPDGTRIVVTPG